MNRFALEWENRSLLVDEGVTGNERAEIVTATETVDSVHEVVDLRTIYFGPDSALVANEIAFEELLDTAGVGKAIDAIKKIDATDPPRSRPYLYRGRIRATVCQRYEPAGDTNLAS